jgi:hypothetical protein
MRSRGWLEIATLGRSSWMPYAPQGVKGTYDDEERFRNQNRFGYTDTQKQPICRYRHLVTQCNNPQSSPVGHSI